MDFAEKGETVPILFTMDKILRYLADQNQSVPLKEISEALGIPRSTASRILFSLYQLGYLEKTAKKPVYRLLYNHAFGQNMVTLRKETLRQVGQEPLRQLAQKLGETTKLSIWDQESCSVEVLCSEIGNSSMHIRVPVGSHFPWHAGAASKLLLAFDKEALATAQRAQTVKLKAYTSNTLTEMGSLLKQLEQIRKEGWAYDQQEYQEGIEAIACPVFHEASGKPALRLLGVLSIPYIARSAIRDRIYREKKQIHNCAERIGKKYAIYANGVTKIF